MACDVNRPFDTSAALALLDEMIDGPGAKAMPALIGAWDSAWIACLTNCPAWAAIAERDFDRAMADTAAVLRLGRDLTTKRNATTIGEAPSALLFFAMEAMGRSHFDQPEAANL